MLSPLMEPKGFGPSLRAPRHSNGPALAAKIAGANRTQRDNVTASLDQNRW
jgi:hypothetical protein